MIGSRPGARSADGSVDGGGLIGHGHAVGSMGGMGSMGFTGFTGFTCGRAVVSHPLMCALWGAAGSNTQTGKRSERFVHARTLD